MKIFKRCVVFMFRERYRNSERVETPMNIRGSFFPFFVRDTFAALTSR